MGMTTLLSGVGSLLSFRVRGRASMELELVALRHQATVLRRQHPGRPRLFSADRLLWVWLYRIWPQVLDAMVLVKPATVVQWHRKGFRLYWRRQSRPLGRPGMSREIRNLIPYSQNTSPTAAPSRRLVMIVAQVMSFMPAMRTGVAAIQEPAYARRDPRNVCEARRMDDVGEGIRKTVIRLLNIDAARVTPDARFVEDLGATSLDIVEIIMALEEEFSVEISDTDAEKMQTVGDVIAFIKSKAA
jgi:acyl carrier protein